MTIIPKVAGFFAFSNLLSGTTEAGQVYYNAILIFSLITLVIGNLAALREINFKRFLAYSGVAHTGLFMMPILFKEVNTFDFYFAGYMLMNFVIIHVVQLLNLTDVSIDMVKGLTLRQPLLGIIFILSLISIAGLPPTYGFLGKYYLFIEVLDDIQQSSLLIPTVAILFLSTLAGFYYYLRIAFFTTKSYSTVKEVQLNYSSWIVLFILSIILIIGFIKPDWMITILTYRYE